jgi:hypothetical protein
MKDLVSVLYEALGRRCTKRWRKVGRSWKRDDFGAGKWFWLRERLIDARTRGASAFVDLLSELSRCRHAMLVHGLLRDGLDRAGLVRRTSSCAEDGGPYFRDTDHAWVMLDADDLEWQGRSMPKDQQSVEADVRLALESVAPECLREADVCVQLSSSCGFKRGRKFSAHFFLALDRPCCAASWSRWIQLSCCLNPDRRRGVKPRYSFDPAVHRPVQPLYIAAPLVEGGPDPLERRGISRVFLLTGERRLASPPDGVTSRAGLQIIIDAERKRREAAAADRERRHLERYGSLSPDEESERIRSALDAIHTGVHYDEWRAIGMALHSWDAIRGKALWDAWSAPDTRFSQRDQDQTWSSFRGQGITIATLFWIACEHGWVAPRRAVRLWRGYE